MKSISKLILPANPTLHDFHKYIHDMEVERGFSEQNVLHNCLQLGEEVGELFKSLRKQQGLKLDPKKQVPSGVAEELADVFIFLLAIANRCGINLEEAFREKETQNKQRTWK